MQGFLVVAPYNHIEGFDIATQTSGWQGGGFWVAANYIDLIDNYLHDIPGAGIQATWVLLLTGRGMYMLHKIIFFTVMKAWM